MIHLDYSENYDSKPQSEIQSAYFGHSSFSIFIGCSYYKEGQYRTSGGINTESITIHYGRKTLNTAS